MGNTLRAIENSATTTNATVGDGILHAGNNSAVVSTIIGAAAGGAIGATIEAIIAGGLIIVGGNAAATAAVATASLTAGGPIGLGLVAGAVIGGLLFGGIAWFMSGNMYNDFQQALNDENLSPIFELMEEIRTMDPGARGPALAELHRLSVEQREISDLYQMFRIALDANFLCANCHSNLELVQICLCHTRTRPQNVSNWTCHCLNANHTCCN